MKKIITIILAIAMICFTFAGCGSNSTNSLPSSEVQTKNSISNDTGASSIDEIMDAIEETIKTSDISYMERYVYPYADDLIYSIYKLDDAGQLGDDVFFDDSEEFDFPSDFVMNFNTSIGILDANSVLIEEEFLGEVEDKNYSGWNTSELFESLKNYYSEDSINNVISRLSSGKTDINVDDIYASFGEYTLYSDINDYETDLIIWIIKSSDRYYLLSIRPDDSADGINYKSSVF